MTVKKRWSSKLEHVGRSATKEDPNNLNKRKSQPSRFGQVQEVNWRYGRPVLGGTAEYFFSLAISFGPQAYIIPSPALTKSSKAIAVELNVVELDVVERDTWQEVQE